MEIIPLVSIRPRLHQPGELPWLPGRPLLPWFQSAPGFISRGNLSILVYKSRLTGFNPPPASSAGGTPCGTHMNFFIHVSIRPRLHQPGELRGSVQEHPRFCFNPPPASSAGGTAPKVVEPMPFVVSISPRLHQPAERSGCS